MSADMRPAASGQVPRFRPEQSPSYLYEQLADYLEGLITAGTLRPHTLLPAERRMTEEYGCRLAPRGMPLSYFVAAGWS